MKISKIIKIFLLMVISTPAVAINVSGVDKKVLYIGVNGVSLNRILAIDAPNFKKLNVSKAYAGGVANDISEQPTHSIPGWATVLTGEWKIKHQITNNSGKQRVASASLYSMLKDTYPKITQSSIVTKENIHKIFSNNMKNINFKIKTESSSDYGALKSALTSIRQGVDFTFVQFSNPGIINHRQGFNENYDRVLKEFDNKLGVLINEVNNRPDFEKWLIIVVTNHGHLKSGYNFGGQSYKEKSVFIASNTAKYHSEEPVGDNIYLGLPQTYSAAMIIDFLSLKKNSNSLIQSKSSYYLKASKYNKWLSFQGKNVRLYPETQIKNKVLWKFIPTGSGTDQYFIQNKWNCESNEWRCGYWLSILYDNIIVNNSLYDKTIWKVVADKTDTKGFYLQNKWHCQFNEKRCNWWLSLNGTNIVLTKDKSLRTMFYAEK